MKQSWLKRVMRKEERRCNKCIDRAKCPAANTGVCFPCPHYRRGS